MKSKATRRKPAARKSKSTRKSVKIHLAGRVTSFFKGKNSFWQAGINRVWAAFGGSSR
ncbi:MAG: hypothetical protein AB7H77_01425 [Bdellovibrionales bacterium]